MSPKRIIFAGTPAFAAAHLLALIAADYQPVCVYTQPDRPAGRGRKLQASEVKEVALANGIEVRQPKSLKSAATQEALAELKPDLMIVVAYGLILPKSVLDIPSLGCINVHGSLLPRWRGAAPIQRAIEAGDSETGITIMQMDVGLDTGDMLLRKHLAITPDETSASLHDRLIPIGQEALIEVLDKMFKGPIKAIPQNDEQATYAHKLDKSESLIQWQDGVKIIDRKIRAMTPWPGVTTTIGTQKVKLVAKIYNEQNNSDSPPGTIISSDKEGLVIQCGEGQLLVTDIQFPGKRMTQVAALLNAYNDVLTVGQVFS